MSSNSSSSSVSGVKGEPQQAAAAASSSSSVRSTPPPPPQSTTPLISSTTPTPSGSSGQATAMAKKPRYDSPKQQLNTNGNSSGAATTAAVSQPRPLVALLDGRDCSVEMPILKEIATVAFCDAQSTSEIHEKVLNEAQAALLYSTIALSREDLLKFRALKLIVKIGVDLDNVDVKAAADLNIAVCNVSACCVEETADSTMSLILSLYRRTHWLASQVEQKLTSKVNGANSHQPTSSGNANHHQAPFIVASTPEQTREVAHGSTRIRGQNLGLVGLDKVALAVAMRARVFGFNVAFYDPNAEEGVDKALGGLTRCSSLAELIKQSDCLSLHSSLTDATYHMINESSLKHVKSSIFLVNTSHHSLVDDVALAIAIKAGTVRAAALDKFAPDSIVVRECSHALVLTPGVAFYSDASMKEMREQAAHEVRRGLLAVAKAPSTLPAANLIGLIGSLKNCVNKDVLISSVASSSTSSASSSASLLGFSNGSSSHHHPATAALMMQLNNSNDNRSNASSINRNMSSGQLSSMSGGATASSTSGVSSVSNNSSSVLSQAAGGRGAGAGSPLINPLMAAAMAASNNLSNPLAAASNLLASPNNAQLLAQLSYFKSAAAGGGGPSSASGFDQLSAAAAAAAALNGVPASSITPALLSYFSPLAAAAAATSSSTSSPSPSPNNPAAAAAALNPSGPPQGGGLGSSQLAALNALISNDPMLQKQAALAAAAQQQHQQQAAMAALLGGVAAVAAAGDGGLKMDSSSPGAENGNSAN